jgi:hypothetical protein
MPLGTFVVKSGFSSLLPGKLDEQFVDIFTLYIRDLAVQSGVPNGQDEVGFLVFWPSENPAYEVHRCRSMG